MDFLGTRGGRKGNPCKMAPFLTILEQVNFPSHIFQEPKRLD
jgi:hypothetical protein